MWTGQKWNIQIIDNSTSANVDTPVPPTDGYDNTNITIKYMKKTKQLTVNEEEIITFERTESNSANKKDTQNPPQYNPVK